jgi:hypothetical protein
MAFPDLYVDMEVDDLSRFIFKDNINDAIIELSLGGVENNKDLFCFFVDLLCKGLILTFGEESSRLDLDKLTLEDFKKIQHKMSLAGINVILHLKENTNHEPSSVNIKEIEHIPDESPLSDFIFRVTSPLFIYRIQFEIVHRV